MHMFMKICFCNICRCMWTVNHSLFYKVSTKCHPFRRQYFQMHFRDWRSLYFDLNITQICSWSFNWWLVCICSRKGVMPDWRQTIARTYDDRIMIWRGDVSELTANGYPGLTWTWKYGFYRRTYGNEKLYTRVIMLGFLHCFYRCFGFIS